jgi:hypothetical protein
MLNGLKNILEIRKVFRLKIFLCYQQKQYYLAAVASHTCADSNSIDQDLQ